MPSTIRGKFAGYAKVFQASLSTEPLLILTALIAVWHRPRACFTKV